MNKKYICPTITAFEPHEYRAQMERLKPFATRIHIDLMDGKFAPSISPPLDQIWWEENFIADIHLMYKNPMDTIEQLKHLKPSLVIVHLESEVDHDKFIEAMHFAQIKVGLALLQESPVAENLKTVAKYDHVLVFSGNLGYHGGEADMGLLTKVRDIRQNLPEIEISWDGGINDQNSLELIEAGVDVLNVGGFIQKSDTPEEAYRSLQRLLL
jgi:pentose-5-phosphate-3-epimerase